MRKGQKVTPEQKKKNSIAHLGMRHTDATKKKMSESRMGHFVSDETRRKISESHKASPNNAWRGKHLPEYVRAKMSESHKGKPKPLGFGATLSRVKKGTCMGELASNWQGGKSFEPYCKKFNKEFKNRVRAFFNYTCLGCGKKQDKTLHVHHVNFNKMSCCDDVKPIFAALCCSCHSKTNFDRQYWEDYYTEVIMRDFNGESWIPEKMQLNTIVAVGSDKTVRLV